MVDDGCSELRLIGHINELARRGVKFQQNEDRFTMIRGHQCDARLVWLRRPRRIGRFRIPWPPVGSDHIDYGHGQLDA